MHIIRIYDHKRGTYLIFDLDDLGTDDYYHAQPAARWWRPRWRRKLLRRGL
jgi:hypothetical protein